MQYFKHALLVVALVGVAYAADPFGDAVKATFHSTHHWVNDMGGADLQVVTVDFNKPIFLTENGQSKAVNELSNSPPTRTSLNEDGSRKDVWMVDPFGCRNHQYNPSGEWEEGVHPGHEESHRGRRMNALGLRRLDTVIINGQPVSLPSGGTVVVSGDRTTVISGEAGAGEGSPDTGAADPCAFMESLGVLAEMVPEDSCGSVGNPWPDEKTLALFTDVSKACGGDDNCAGRDLKECPEAQDVLVEHLGEEFARCFDKPSDDTHSRDDSDDSGSDVCDRLFSLTMKAEVAESSGSCGAVGDPWDSEEEMTIFKEVTAACGGDDNCSGHDFETCGNEPQVVLQKYFGDDILHCFGGEGDGDYHDGGQPTADQPCDTTRFDSLPLELPEVSRKLAGLATIKCEGGELGTTDGSVATGLPAFAVPVPSTVDPASFLHLLNRGLSFNLPTSASQVSFLLIRNIEQCYNGFCSLNKFIVDNTCTVEFKEADGRKLTFADGSDVSLEGQKLEARPNICSESDLIGVQQMLQSAIDEYDTATSWDDFSRIDMKMNLIQNMHGFRVCEELLQSVVTYGEMEVTIQESTQCDAEYESEEWKADPCCNWELREEQCCLPRPATKKIWGVTGFDANRVEDRCPDSLSAAAAMIEYTDTAVFTETCEAWEKESNVWDELHRFSDECHKAIYGESWDGVSCESDADCYTECKANEKKCAVPYNDPEPYLLECYLDKMDSQTHRRLLRLWNLKASTPMETFQSEFRNRTSDETCVGPDAWMYKPRWEYKPATDCDDLEHFAQTGEYCPWESVYHPADKDKCLEKKDCNWKSCYDVQYCHIESAAGNRTRCEDDLPYTYHWVYEMFGEQKQEGDGPVTPAGKCVIAHPTGQPSRGWCERKGFSFSYPDGCSKKCLCEVSYPASVCRTENSYLDWDYGAGVCTKRLGGDSTCADEGFEQHSEGDDRWCALPVTVPQEHCGWTLQYSAEEESCYIQTNGADTCATDGGSWGGGETCTDPMSPEGMNCFPECVDPARNTMNLCQFDYNKVNGGYYDNGKCRVHAQDKSLCVESGYQYFDDCEKHCKPDASMAENFCGQCWGPNNCYEVGRSPVCEVQMWDESRCNDAGHVWDSELHRCKHGTWTVEDGKAGCIPEGFPVTSYTNDWDGVTTYEVPEVCLVDDVYCNYNYYWDWQNNRCRAQPIETTDCDFTEADDGSCITDSTDYNTCDKNAWRDRETNSCRASLSASDCIAFGGNHTIGLRFQSGSFHTEELCQEGRCSDGRIGVSAEECGKDGHCSMGCPLCEGSMFCYNTNLNETECERFNGHMQVWWDTGAPICRSHYAEKDADCVDLGTGWKLSNCGALNKAQCGNTNTTDDGVNLLNTAATCYWNEWGRCDQESCEKNGRCHDWELQYWDQNSNTNYAGVCVKPYDRSNGYPECNWNNNERYTEFGCVVGGSNTADGCPDGTSFKGRAKNKEECEAHGTRCIEKHHMRTRKDPETCAECGGNIENMFYFEGGRWISNHIESLTWAKRGYQNVNDWKESFNQTKFDRIMEAVISNQLGEMRKTSAMCRLNPKVKALKALACACSPMADEDRCKANTDRTVVGELTAFSGLSSTLSSSGVGLATEKDSVNEETDSVAIELIYMSGFEATNAWLKSKGASSRRRLAETDPNLPDCKNVEAVVNGNGQVVGQVMGTIVEASAKDGEFSAATICSSITFKNVNEASYTVNGFANAETMELGSFEVTQPNDAKLCAKITAPGRYIPVKVKADTSSASCKVNPDAKYDLAEIVSTSATPGVPSVGGGDAAAGLSTSVLTVAFAALLALLFV